MFRFQIGPIRLPDSKLDFIDDVPKKAERRELALKLWRSATAKDPAASDMRRRALAMAQLNPKRAFEIADMRAGSSVDSTKMGGANSGWFRKRRRCHGGPEKDNGSSGGASRIGGAGGLPCADAN